ncbi:hypothetical protein C3Y87_15005 [Carbonactinospora thermoautotrophica]|uniref:hypothetical protein n=1 Tax=Carbonactinospora thermoautotrophica TaxID=1469144 RepID=UPI00226E8A95|nr:hypothetical protein [Carbonactinospora thermoautotrophica]MCX9192695.1 hypothetical protein [Carbonactinospora thermoautotrophica]
MNKRLAWAGALLGAVLAASILTGVPANAAASRGNGSGVFSFSDFSGSACLTNPVFGTVDCGEHAFQHYGAVEPPSR